MHAGRLTVTTTEVIDMLVWSRLLAVFEVIRYTPYFFVL